MWCRFGLVALVLVGACRSHDDAPEQHPVLAPAADPWSPTAPQVKLDPPTVRRPMPHPFVWTAEKDGHVTYLLGTYHGGVDADDELPQWVWDQLAHSTTLAEEVDLQDPQITAWTVRSDDSTLHAELGPEYWKRFEEIVTPGVAQSLDHGATSLAVLRIAGLGGTAPTMPMDGTLRVRAQEAGKHLVFLEDARFQSALLTKLLDLGALKRLIDHSDEIPALNRRYFEAYEAGDGAVFPRAGAELSRLQAGDDAAYQELMSSLLYDRNRAWIPEIEKLHAAGGAFIAVGALHLLAEHNVLDLLRERGFAIRRMPAS